MYKQRGIYVFPDGEKIRVFSYDCRRSKWQPKIQMIAKQLHLGI